jgi:hypothetical protein
MLTGLALQCAPDGRPIAFVYHLPAQMRVAFLTRTLTAHLESRAPRPPTPSPLLPMVRELYLRDGAKIVGELPPSDGDGLTLWPTVVVQALPHTAQ